MGRSPPGLYPGEYGGGGSRFSAVIQWFDESVVEFPARDDIGNGDEGKSKATFGERRRYDDSHCGVVGKGNTLLEKLSSTLPPPPTRNAAEPLIGDKGGSSDRVGVRGDVK